jgi:hypothetical protein
MYLKCMKLKWSVTCGMEDNVLILAITCPISTVNLFSTVLYSTIISDIDISVSRVLLLLHFCL